MVKINVYLIAKLVYGIMMLMAIIIVQINHNVHQKNIHNILEQHNIKNVYKNVEMNLYLLFIQHHKADVFNNVHMNNG